MDFKQFSRTLKEEQFISYIKYVRELAENSLIENDIETMEFDSPSTSFIYLIFLKKMIDKTLSEKITNARKKINPKSANLLAKTVTDFNNMVLNDKNIDFSNCYYFERNFNELLDGLEEKNK